MPCQTIPRRRARYLSGLAAALFLAAALPARASDRVDHYDPEPPRTLAEAVEGFVTHNRQMTQLLARHPLGPQDMEEIHRLTYTLELALARINAELGALPAVLEEVHLTSEGGDPAALRAIASRYLETATTLDR